MKSGLNWSAMSEPYSDARKSFAVSTVVDDCEVKTQRNSNRVNASSMSFGIAASVLTYIPISMCQLYSNIGLIR